MRHIKAAIIALILTGSAQAADPMVTYSAATGDEMVAACEEAIAQWAAQFDPIEVNTSVAGPIESQTGGNRMAKLDVEIVYDREGGPEPRSATIDCTMDLDGAITVAEAS